MPKITTQDFLEFEQIREGIIILKNKALRAVLMVSSQNFALKSEEEQNAILYQFQDFLNSLDFSCQILIHSRRINIIGYLDKLKELGQKEENELLKMAMTELNFSARAYDKILKVSRTIADLSGSEEILAEHLSEAIQYRSLDRDFFI